jgi:hypothetical protein
MAEKNLQIVRQNTKELTNPLLFDNGKTPATSQSTFMTAHVMSHGIKKWAVLEKLSAYFSH